MTLSAQNVIRGIQHNDGRPIDCKPLTSTTSVPHPSFPLIAFFLFIPFLFLTLFLRSLSRLAMRLFTLRLQRTLCWCSNSATRLSRIRVIMGCCPARR
ncbi:hypothetical protein BDV12DRAFT_72940 [Aspergillus spectabilis]